MEATPQVLGMLRRLIAGAVRAPEDDPPRGARPEELDCLQERLGGSLSPVLRAWLSVCRGARIGPGGVFGASPDMPDVDMARRRDLCPEWPELGWLPVAGDGCGNYYVLLGNGTVGFVDTMKDPGQVDRQVAGDLLSFMTDLLAQDQHAGRAHS
jgi:SMI1 / KNR4 family (SUKH-1)